MGLDGDGCGKLWLGAAISFLADAAGLKGGLAVAKGLVKAVGGRTVMTQAGGATAGVGAAMVAGGATDVASGVTGSAVRNGVADEAAGDDYDNGLTGTAEDVVEFLEGWPILGTGLRLGDAIACTGEKIEQLATESVWKGIDH